MNMTHFKLTIGRQPSKTTQTIFAANLAAMLMQHGADVTVEQESGKVHSGTALAALMPTNPQSENTEVLIYLEGQ